MRIIGGELRGRRIEAPAGLATRPSSDRLRETLFAILGPAVVGRAFVDAFAGSGAVGLEALSRGAHPVVWIESAATPARALRANLARLGRAGPGVEIWERPAARALPALARRGGCDYFFLDPPYDDLQAYGTVLRGLDRGAGALRPHATVIAEARRGAAMPPLERLRLRREHRVGDSVLWFFSAE